MNSGLSDDDALTADGWWRRCEAKRVVAGRMVDDRKHCREAWIAAGFAVEFALKASICKRERFNAWPSRDSRPDLHQHDLKKLFEIAGIDLRAAPADTQAAIRQVLDWNRKHDYDAKPMPRKVARSMFEAAFGGSGVVIWLKSLPT
jgi:hypothetical protein